MWQSLHDAWWRLATLDRPQSLPDALACRALATGAAAYRAAVALRNTAYDRRWLSQTRLPCRVVSIGNLTVGGTGKTACVELIASRLTGMGRKAAVLSRGYGGRRGEYTLRWAEGRLTVNPDDPGGGPLADEPQLLARRLPGVPVLVGRRRDRTGRVACGQLGADTLILDDGFQHRRVARDCEVVLVHARMPFGGWAMLPRGPMREPLASLRRADVIIISKADEALSTIGALSERLRSFNRGAVLATAAHEPTDVFDASTRVVGRASELENRRVGLLSSIGDPAGFEATVKRLHATVAWHTQFPDHHPYDAADWQRVLGGASRGRPDAIVTTEKDWVRLEPLVQAAPAPMPVLILGIRMRLLTGDDALTDRLAALHVR
jgi:tetraacyldisaccharide 4'-kinase